MNGAKGIFLPYGKVVVVGNALEVRCLNGMVSRHHPIWHKAEMPLSVAMRAAFRFGYMGVVVSKPKIYIHGRWKGALEQLTHPELELDIPPNTIWDSFPMLGAKEQHEKGEQISALHKNTTPGHLIFALELFGAVVADSYEI
jgi:hypothetical protein